MFLQHIASIDTSIDCLWFAWIIPAKMHRQLGMRVHEWNSHLLILKQQLIQHCVTALSQNLHHIWTVAVDLNIFFLIIVWISMTMSIDAANNQQKHACVVYAVIRRLMHSQTRHLWSVCTTVLQRWAQRVYQLLHLIFALGIYFWRRPWVLEKEIGVTQNLKSLEPGFELNQVKF